MTQARQHVTSTQPEVGPIKIYSGPQAPYDSGKQPLTLLVRFKDSDDLGEIVINEQDFNSEVHELVE